ncbi:MULTISPECIES: ABC transporter permease [Caballeronia]|uniref:ABC transporter permease n=1 Tax=Caballeronia TaxID=1827195 RepID=UPI00045EF019|nr:MULTISPECIES: ABC transporter permease [unclassified Caballeronia]MCE4543990.1 ABC transporter permease [Caballeronia sp. PC1]MCE4571141.1 ABC transporter permease [Caballeronia sp. CLC5]BAO88329.1 ABC spermidine/putrescine transporter, inner membrane subunit [Burkholderia sp. RPE67]BBP98942.1 ABC transporter permease [Burkholderia sp. SFA1]
MNYTLNVKTVVVMLLPLYALLAVFFLWPLGVVGWSSIWDQRFTLRGYEQVLTNPLIHRVLVNTLTISALATLASLVLGYIVALHLARLPASKRAPYLVMVMLPFWTSILVKSYAFTVVLGSAGIVARLAGWLSGDAWHPELMFNRAGVVIGMTNYLLPFMVLPILTSLTTQNRNLKFAAEMMGAGAWMIFARITLPLSMPGVIAGVLMCLTLSMGMYITPALLGGPRDMMLANLIDFYTRTTLDWTLAASIAMMLLVLSGILIGMLGRVQQGREALA